MTELRFRGSIERAMIRAAEKLKTLLRFVESAYLARYSKLFLVVADFNINAKKLYKRIGYSEIGKIHDLYRKGISEYLMMKVKEEESTGISLKSKK